MKRRVIFSYSKMEVKLKEKKELEKCISNILSWPKAFYKNSCNSRQRTDDSAKKKINGQVF